MNSGTRIDHQHTAQRWHAAMALGLAMLLCACSTPGVTDLSARPAEGALINGLRAYEDGQYAESEKLLGTAVQARLASRRDEAAAYKHLAFIYCTSNRLSQCEAAFRAARKADSRFSLSKAEAGHPLWGPVYRKIAP